MPIESAPAAPAYDFAAYLQTLPPLVSVKAACSIRNVSRTRFYQLAGEGRIRLVKDGATTLADTASLIADLMRLPAAEIQPPADRRASLQRQK